MPAYINQENYKEFVDTYNIINGQLSSQHNLNKSVNVIKKESLDSHNRLEILRGAYAVPWAPEIEYHEGEIVSFTSNPGTPNEVTKNYAVKPGKVALNKIPDSEPDYWEEVTINDYLASFDQVVMDNYLAKDNTDPYTPTGDYNPATKKYVDDTISIIYKDGNPNNGYNYLTLDNTTPYTPTGDYNPATKKYVNDTITTSLQNVTTSNSEKLQNREASGYMALHREFSGNYNGMGVKNGPAADDLNTTDWIRTTANGILPYDQTERSNIGDEEWKFKGMYALNFYGNLNNTYEADDEYEEGTILEIGYETEVRLYNGGKVAGVVVSTIGRKVTLLEKGRCFVKISGSAERGQYINAYQNGLGIASDTKTDKTVGVCITPGYGTCEIKV